MRKKATQKKGSKQKVSGKRKAETKPLKRIRATEEEIKQLGKDRKRPQKYAKDPQRTGQLLDEAIKNELSEYERLALTSIHEWKKPKIAWSDKAMQIINWPLEKAGDLITEVPGVDWVIEKAIGGIVGLLNDLAHWTVRPEAIYEEYRKSGFEHIKTPRDMFSLDLEEADRVNGWLGAKYKTLAALEGAAAGYVGLPGIPPDIVALITLNQRAIGEYATYYGFDISSQQERLFALNILGFASSPNDAAKQVAMAQLVRIAQDVAKKKVWKDLEKHSFVRIIQIIARSLGIRLTKAKLAQIIPVTGAIVGAGFNAYYTNKVCDAAFYLYRERFLAEKYGADVIEETVKPADSYEPDFGDDGDGDDDDGPVVPSA